MTTAAGKIASGETGAAAVPLLRPSDTRCVDRRPSFFRLVQGRLGALLRCIVRTVCWRRCRCMKTRQRPPPVQVYILLGQSNMLGMGRIHGDQDGSLDYAVRTKHLYPYLVDVDDDDDSHHWTTSSTVRHVRVMRVADHMHVYHNEFLTVRGDTIGPELGIGHSLEEASDSSPVMLLKSCIGNRSLGWDLLPPKSPRFAYKGQTYAGYGESPASWPADQPPPAPMNNWYAGKQYDDDIANAKSVLQELDRFYPDANSYEICGFFWWQGDKDRYSEAYASRYEPNLVALIQQLRRDFRAPDAKFVLATLGQTDLATATGTEALMLKAMLAVDGKSGQYAELAGNVTTVYAHPLSQGGASNSHYNGNAETYMNIGRAMGRAMVDLVFSGDDDD